MSKKNILIKNGRILDPATDFDAITDLAIHKNKIVGIGDEIPTNFGAHEVIDAQGCWVLPGIVDLGAYLREPG